MLSATVRADTVSVSLGELSDALVSAREQPDAVKQLVLEKIQREFDAADLRFTDGELLLEDELTNRIVEDGCTSTVINQMRTAIEVAADSALSLQFDSLYEPLIVQVELNTILDIDGTARQTFGVRLGSCQQLARDTFTFTADGPLSVRLAVRIELNPSWIASDTLRLKPAITLEGELTESRIRVDVDDSVLRSLLEDYLQDEVESLLSPARLIAEIAELQDSVNQQLAESLADDGQSPEDAGTLDVNLPAADDEQIIALYELLTPTARFPLTTGFIAENRFQLLAALLLDDADAVNDLLQNAAECELTSVLQTDLPLPVVYANSSGECRVQSSFSSATTLYTDALCTEGFDYFPTDLLSFCSVALAPEQLGNGAANSEQLGQWTLSPGTRFDVGTLTIKGKQQPFVQRQSYKRAQTAGGVCDLEMRVYNAQPGRQNQKSLIALHGGSWQYRGTGFLGIENMATHFTDAGFVVFAPFYRLVGDGDGTVPCQSASLQDLLDDVDDALAWVVDNQQSYGASGKPVLFGQSAGGHLAASLAVRQADAVERSVLFYAPVDFRDFAQQIKQSDIVGGQGERILQAVTGQSIESLDLNSALVTDNSFPSIVTAQPQQYPPFYLLHGESDTLLPSRQSERMCDALGGLLDSADTAADTTADTSAAANTSFTSLIKSVACDDRGSQMHLIAQGEHTLDLCISSELCLAGSPASAKVTSDAIQAMLVWSAADTLTGYKPAGSASGNSGGSGSVDVALLWLLGLLVFRRGFVSQKLQKKLARH